MQEKLDRIAKMTETAIKPDNAAAVELIDEWFAEPDNMGNGRTIASIRLHQLSTSNMG